MPTVTLKNIPNDLHAKLKKSATRNRRSLNSEILIRLESEFTAPRVSTRFTPETLKAFTDQFPEIDHSKVDVYKRQGRA